MSPSDPQHKRDVVLVLDFGAQYAQLIARKVREAGVYSEIVSSAITAEELFNYTLEDGQPTNIKGVILSGGPKSVHVEHAPKLDQSIYGLEIPTLGICYGAQLLAHNLGGSVNRSGRGEYGRTTLNVLADSQLLGGLSDRQSVWMSHFDAIETAPADCLVTASTTESPVAAFENPDMAIYGVQFHPEVAHTPNGKSVIEHFVLEACGGAPDWTLDSIIEDSVSSIRAKVGDRKHAICGLSGEWIRRWLVLWRTGLWESALPVFSLTLGCCALAKGNRLWKLSGAIWGPIWCILTLLNAF